MHRFEILPLAVLLVACGSKVTLGDSQGGVSSAKGAPARPGASESGADAGPGGSGAVEPGSDAGPPGITGSGNGRGGEGGYGGEGAQGGQGGYGGVAGYDGVAGYAGAISDTTPRCHHISTKPGDFNPCGDTTTIAYSPDGKIVVTAGETPPPNVHLWNLSDGSLLRDLDGIEMGVYTVAFSPDGSLLAVVGERHDGTGDSSDIAKLYDVASGRQVRALPVSTGFYSSAAAFSNDGTLLATAGENGSIELWRVSDGTRVNAIAYPNSVHNVHFAPMGSEIIVGGYDGRATVYAVPSGNEVFSLSPIASEMADAAFSPDGTQIASTGDGPAGDVIEIWDVASRKLLQSLSGHQGYVSHVIWIDQNHLVSNDWVGTVRRWNRQANGSFAAADVWTTNGAHGIAVSPDKKTLCADASQDPEPTPGNISGFEFLSL